MKISHSVDDPPRIFYWSIEELIPFFIFLAAGIFTGRLLTMVMVGLVFTKIYSAFISNAADKYLQHLVYWKAGISLSKSTIVPNAFDKEFL